MAKMTKAQATEAAQAAADKVGGYPRSYRATDSRRGYVWTVDYNDAKGDRLVSLAQSSDGTYFAHGLSQFMPPHGSRFKTIEAAYEALTQAAEREKQRAQDVLDALEGRS